jgi:hypothetical protein
VEVQVAEAQMDRVVGVVQEVIGLPQGHQAAVHLPNLQLLQLH